MNIQLCDKVKHPVFGTGEVDDINDHYKTALVLFDNGAEQWVSLWTLKLNN